MTHSVVSSNFTEKMNKGKGLTVKSGSHSSPAHSEANELGKIKREEEKRGEKSV